MKQNKPLYVIIALLVMVNVISLFLLWKGKRSTHMPERPERGRHFLQKELDLTEEQAVDLSNTFMKHREGQKKITSALSKERQQLFNALHSGQAMDSAEAMGHIKIIGKEQEALEWLNYRHVKEVKKILTPEQREKFFQLVKRVHNGRGDHRPGFGPRREPGSR